MALIKDSLGRQDEDSGYGRVFGNGALGKLISRVHVCSIRNGNELERLLREQSPYCTSLDKIIRIASSEQIHSLEKLLVAFGTEIRNFRKGFGKDMPLTDVVIFDPNQRRILVIELKDGDTFDTKKADGELASARKFADWISVRVTVDVLYFFCSFNQGDKDKIVHGVKSRFSKDQVLTGAELCALIGVDYVNMRNLRKEHQSLNRDYFVKQLLQIPEIRDLIKEHIDNA